MKKILLLVAITAAMPSFLSAQTDSIAPSAKLDVSVNGKSYSMNEGDTLNVDGKAIVVRLSEYTTFNYGALRFDYPKNFAFKFEEDYSYKLWTLDGNDFVIMYFEFSAKVDVEPIIDGLVKKFGKKNCKLEDRKIKIGAVDLQGTRINVSLVETKLSQDVYLVKTNDYKSHIVIFQDTKKDDGSDSVEAIRVMNILNKTFTVK